MSVTIFAWSCEIMSVPPTFSSAFTSLAFFLAMLVVGSEWDFGNCSKQDGYNKNTGLLSDSWYKKLKFLLCINAYRLTAIHIYIWIELVLKISTSLLSSRIFSIRLQSNFQHLSQFVICLRKHLIIICVGEEKLIWKFTNFFTTEIKLLFSHFSLKFNQFIQKKKRKRKKKKKSQKSYLS